MKDKFELLNEINETSFGVLELNLYLDTHPQDTKALQLFHELKQRRKTALAAFEKEYYPLTVDCIGPDQTATQWTWGDAPAPWEGAANVEL